MKKLLLMVVALTIGTPLMAMDAGPSAAQQARNYPICDCKKCLRDLLASGTNNELLKTILEINPVFMEQDIDTDEKADGFGRTVLLLAVIHANNEMVGWLLFEKHANPNTSTFLKLTPLTAAARIDNETAANYLLAAGAQTQDFLEKRARFEHQTNKTIELIIQHMTEKKEL